MKDAKISIALAQTSSGRLGRRGNHSVCIGPGDGFESQISTVILWLFGKRTVELQPDSTRARFNPEPAAFCTPQLALLAASYVYQEMTPK